MVRKGGGEGESQNSHLATRGDTLIKVMQRVEYDTHTHTILHLLDFWASGKLLLGFLVLKNSKIRQKFFLWFLFSLLVLLLNNTCLLPHSYLVANGVQDISRSKGLQCQVVVP